MSSRVQSCRDQSRHGMTEGRRDQTRRPFAITKASHYHHLSRRYLVDFV